MSFGAVLAACRGFKCSSTPELSVTCPAITPTVGPTELLTDPGLEAAYTAGLCDTLTKTGSPTLSDAGAGAHGGSHAQTFTATAQNNAVAWSPVVVAAGTWVQGTLWGKRTAGSASGMTFGMTEQGVKSLRIPLTSATYVQALATYRSTAANKMQIVLLDGHATTWDTGVIDDGSIMALTFSTCLSYLGSRNSRPGTYTCKPTLTAGTQCGIALAYKDSANLVLAYHDGTNAKLDKCVAGTWTAVITGAAAYGAGKALKVVVAANGTDYSLYYDGAQIGATTAITDGGLGTGVCGFSTYASNTVGLVTTTPAVA